MKVKDDKHKLTWRNCCDLSHAWTGLVTLTPGQAEPYHRHTTPMFYYILQVSHDMTTHETWLERSLREAVMLKALCRVELSLA